MKRIKSLVALLVLCVRAVEFVFGDRADQSLDLVALRYLHMLQTHGSVDANFALIGTSQQHWRVLAELDHGLWCVNIVACNVLVEVADHWHERIYLQVPNLDSSIVGDTCEHGRGVGRPINIVDLLLERFNLVAGKFGCLLLRREHSHRPIIGASEENRTVILVPEGIASDFVDGARVSRERLQILLRVRHRAHVNGAVFGGSEVSDVALVVLGEVDRETARVDESHAAALFLGFGSSVDILLVGVCFPLQLHELCVLETFPQGPLDDLAVARNRDQTFALVFTLHPLDVPHDVRVLKVQIFRLCNRLRVGASNIINRNVAARVANSNQMWRLLTELTACDAGVVHDHLLREVRIL